MTDHLQRELRATTSETPFTKVSEIIAQAASLSREGRLQGNFRQNILRLLIDRIAPHIDEAVFTNSENIEHISRAQLSFNIPFLDGDLSQSVLELLSLVTPDTSGANCRAQTLFALARSSTRLELLLHAVGDPSIGHDIANALVNLPSHIATLSRGNVILSEELYFKDLAKAYVELARTFRGNIDEQSAQLLSRLVVLGKADILVRTWLSESNGSRCEHGQKNMPVAAALICAAPDAAMPKLLRALIEHVDRHSAKSEQLARLSVCAVVAEREVARRYVSAPSTVTRHPLLRHGKTAIRRLVDSVRIGAGEEFAKESLRNLADVWGSEDFAKGADEQVQRISTRTVLEYLRVLLPKNETRADSNEQDLILALAHGVHYRMSSADFRVRRFGMVVAESFSRRTAVGNEKALCFPRDGGNAMEKDKVKDNGDAFDGDSDFSELAEDTDRVASDIEDDDDDDDDEDFDAEARARARNEEIPGSTERSSAIAEKRADDESKLQAEKNTCMWDFGDDMDRQWLDADDWESLEALSLSSFGGEDAEMASIDSDLNELSLRSDTMRTHVSALGSVPRLLAFLRSVPAAVSDGSAKNVVGPRAILESLREIRRRLNVFPADETLLSASREVIAAVMRIDHNAFAEEDGKQMQKEKEELVKECARKRFADVGTELVAIASGDNADLSSRSQALSLLADCARAAAATVSASAGEEDEGAGIEELQQKQVIAERIGTVTRIGTRVLRGDGNSTVNRKDAYAVRCWHMARCETFFRLANGLGALSQGAKAPDVLAQMLATLVALYALNKGNGGGGMTLLDGGVAQREMENALLQFACDFKNSPHAPQRRAAALAVGAVVDQNKTLEIHDLEVSMHGNNTKKEVLQWLVHALNEDHDVYVRRFAAATVAKIAASNVSDA